MKRRKRRLNPIYWMFQFLGGLVAISSLFWIPYLVEKYGRRWANRNKMNRGAEIEYTPLLKKKFLENFIEREIPKNKTYWLFGARFPFKEYEVEA